jgi:glycosyltransferase involved in cell wall biosynthesis
MLEIMMEIGIAISDNDSPRVLQDIYQELALHNNVDIFKFRKFKSPIFYYRIDRILRKYDLAHYMQNKDVVYFEWASDLLAYASNFKKTCGIVTRLHRYEMFQWVDKINWSFVDKLIVLSDAMALKFELLYPKEAHKVVVIPWAIYPDKYILKPDTFSLNIGTLCEITPRKRVYELILSFSLLIKKNNDIRLHIGGDIDRWSKDYYDAILYLIRNLGLQDRVYLDGKISDVPNWLKQIDVFVSNSFSEGIQSALLEAMATGCYCLSHHWDGAEEILPVEQLFFTDEELLDKLSLYFESPENRKVEYKDQMRRVVCGKFNNTLLVPKIRSVIEDVGKDYL